MDIRTRNQNGTTGTDGRLVSQTAFQSCKQEMREKQNIYKGIIGGSAVAIVGAFLWAFITETTGYEMGWMAIGVGFLVGYSVRITGKGIDTIFGVAGGILALLGCIGGNVFTVAYSISSSHCIPITTVISQIKLQTLLSILHKTFSPVDFLFYGLAVYEGFKYSIAPIEPEQRKI